MGYAYPIDSKVVSNPNGTIDYDRASSSAQLRGLIKSMITNGVNLTESTNLQVIANGTNNTLTVKAGYVIIEGAIKHFENDVTVTLPTADMNNSRIDTVVARLNLNESVRDIVIDVVSGTASATPTEPTLTRTSNYYEVGLANILVGVGASVISQSEVTDTRLLNSRCGLATSIGKIDTETLFTQLTTDFNNWFDNIKGQLSEDAAGNLQLQINAINDELDTTLVEVEEKVNNITNNLITVTVTSNQEGLQVTFTKDDFSSTKTITDGTATFNLPKCGNYVVSNNLNSKTKILEAKYYGQYSLVFNPWAVWGVDIDTTNSNPETSVTYTDDAVGIEPNSSEWDEIIGNKPCILDNGVVLGYLNPNDYTKYENGTSAPITTVGKDVMVEFPKRGYKITTENNIVKIRLTDNPNASGYSYKPFSRNAEGDRDYFYYGAYKGYVSSSKLYSVSGNTPTVNQTRATFRTYAKSRGTGYAQNGFYQLTYLQCCYLLRFKNLNSQEAVGYGYANGNSASIATGGTNTAGMNSELMSASDRTGGKKQIKCLGIEDFWGNIFQWVDGITTDSSRRLCVCHIPSSFSDSTSGTNINVIASGVSSDIGNYLSKVQGSTDGGFVAKEVNGSDSTYFCDSAILYASRVASFGGNWNDGASAGAFYLRVNFSASSASASIGSRLMYV